MKCANGHDVPTWTTPGEDGEFRYANNAFEPEYEKFCFECAYWTRRLDQRHEGTCIFAAGDGPFGDAEINLSSFNWNEPLLKRCPGVMLGFSGRLWKIEFLDGRAMKQISTNNLWYAGEMPELFRNRVRVNARLVGNG